MFSTRIYLKIVFQVAIIVIVAGLGLAGIVSGKAIILGCVTLLIALWLDRRSRLFPERLKPPYPALFGCHRRQ